MASKDIINPVDVNNPSSTRRSADLLPTYHRTDKNTKFLSSTLDQLIQQPQIERVNGFVGSKLSLNYNPSKDEYLESNTKLKNDYRLEPALAITDVNKAVKKAFGFDDLINELAFNGADVSNLDRLFRPQSYSYDPMIDWDKFVNFRQYFWLPTGPDAVTITGAKKSSISTYSVKDSDDGFTLIFTPDGATTNPLLTLYRGMTYVFNVDSAYPFYVKTAYVSGAESLYSNTTNNGTKIGQVIVTIDDYTPNFLFYYAEGNPGAIGQFAVKSLAEDTVLDIEADILGKKTYTSGNGITLSNGMKVRFVGNVSPDSYLNKEFIVEGVGSAISLIDFQTLQTVGVETTDLDVNFDSNPFDQYPFDDFRYVPLTPEYITINRAALDRNAWSRYNRWTHQDVIEATAKANGVPAVYPADQRAQRPIIEFAPGLQLFNYGSVGKENVDLIDNVITDAFKTVENSAGLYIDGVLVDAGYRVIFNADKDPLVRGKVYEVKIVNINNRQKIDLEEVLDSTPLLNEAVIATRGNTTAGTAWWFDGSKWQLGQQKTSLNQFPLFELYDEHGNSFSDQSFYKSSFSGTTIFNYKIGTIYDSILKFNLAYRNVANVGEYLFENTFMTDTFTNFVNNQVELLYVSNGYFKVNSTNGSKFRTVWTKTVDRPIPIIQYQVVTEETIYVELNSIDNPGYATDLILEVFVNNKKLISNVDFIKSVDGDRAFVVSTSKFNVNDRVLIKLYTAQPPNNNGYYEPPINLTNNPLNGPAGEFSFTELSDHVKTMADSNPEFVGEFPGTSNLRDLENYSHHGTRIVSHSNPLSMAQYFLGSSDHNIISSVRKVSEDYNQFKSNLLRHITDLKGTYSPAQCLDLALIALNNTRDNSFNYNYSDMLAYGKNNTTRIFTVTNPRNVRYSLPSIFDTTVLSNRAVLVYHNGNLLVKDYDYEVSQYEPSVIIKSKLAKNDTITIIDYPNTAGSFVPPTPTKLGLYPKFKPEIFFDTTYASGPVRVIQGHDGSITVAFNDYRDDVLLEFERRVYNNIKVSYNPDLFNIDEIIPGAFRKSKFSTKEINDLMAPDFLRWAGFFGVDYINNSTFDELNSFTFNYTGTIDTLAKRKLSGYWRGIYKFFFDTDRPHTHPWEMLGFREKPTWWESVYGPAPYTKGNLILWKDLEEGRIADPANSQINPLYARPGLSNVIPVDDAGNLLSPADSGLSLTPIYNPNDEKRIVLLRSEQIASKWTIGDHSPAETAWRRSSWYPFAVQVVLALTSPASYASMMFDPSRMKITIAGELRYGDQEDFLSPSKLFLYNDIVNDSRVLSCGYSVFVAEAYTSKNSNAIAEIKEDLANIDYRLMAKLGAFVSKDKLSVGIDAIDPASPYPGLLLPSEDYQIYFSKSSPIKSFGISGLIIQKTGTGWSIRGYDRYNPYFTVFKPFASNVDQTLRVGGVSEKFVNWLPNVIYNEGQIVFYSERYYRVLKKHNSDTVFDSVYYQSLPYLPVVGGVGVQRRTRFDTVDVIVPYGVEYRTIQEVYDFIVGYGKWLESKGFVFDEFNSSLEQVLDWEFTAKEFLFWSTQNWEVNSVITLSPFANKIVFRSDVGVVESIVTAFNEYSLLKADGAPFPKNNFTVVRLDGEFVLSTMNTQEGLFFARINLVQKEHALVMNNFTLFNDVIYDIETGYRQRRIKLKGFITKGWNGDFFSPGFVFDQATVSDWAKFTDYRVGDVVRFSGNYYSAIKTIPGSASFDITQWAVLTEKPEPALLPNFEYKINQFEDFYSLDIDNFDVGQQAMAQHLVGYTPRPYLNYIIGDPISQYKFYQGFIREKGTRNPLDKLGKASLTNYRSTVDFNEEWAFRIGYYGGFNTFEELETTLETPGFVENPQILKFVTDVPSDNTDSIYYKDQNSVLVKPSNFTVDAVFKSSDDVDNIIKFPIAGYVRFDDIDSTAFNKNSILDIANNTALTTGNTIWLGFRDDGDWDVLRVTEIPTYVSGVEINVPGQSLILSTYYSHQLSVGDLVSVTRVGAGIDQCYIVQEVLSQNQFVVLSTLTSLPVLNDPLTGLIFAFKSSRLNNFDKISEIPFLDRWNFEEKIWVDSDSLGKWSVYKKTDNYSGVAYDSELSEVTGQHFGYAISSNDGSNVLVVSSPDYVPTLGNSYYGNVFVLLRNTYDEYQLIDNFSLIDRSGDAYYTVSASSTQTWYGYSLAFDSSTNLIIAGAPKTSRVNKTFTATNRTFIVDKNTPSTTPILNQGVVKLSLLNTSSYSLITNKSVVITTSVAKTGTNFGWSIALSNPYENTTTIKVSSTASVVVGYAVTGTYVVGSPVVTSIGDNLITFSVPQKINTTTSRLYFSKSVLATTEVENTSTIEVASTSGILLNSFVQGMFIAGQPTVTGIGDGQVIVSSNQTISTSSLITFVNTSTAGYSIGTQQKLLVGAPSVDTTSTGSVYVFDLDVTAGTTGNIAISTGSQLTLSYPSYSTNEFFGWSVSGNKTLTRVAVSAPGYTGTNQTSIGAVYVYDLTTSTTYIQKITGETADLGKYALVSNSFFANKVVMSQDGEYLFVASPYSIDPEYNTRTGVVDSFKWNGNKFVHHQRFNVPLSSLTSSTVFGYDISLSGSNEVLVITSVGEAKTVAPTFDKYVGDIERKSQTTFDSNATGFTSKIKNAGTAHVYNKLGNGSTKWAYGQQLIANSIAEGSMFGSSSLALEDSVFVGAPAKLLNGSQGYNTGTGQFFVFDKLDKLNNTWALHRTQEPLVDISSIKRVVTIDTDKDQIQDYFDIIDPVKGKILGSIQEELRFITPYDPAIYSLGIAGVNVDSDTNWLDEHVGDLWWDLSTVKFVWYEQGELEYRKNNWNSIFPGCSIDVYEWIRSEYLPAEWAQLADTAEGLTQGISGQPKFNDNSVISVKQVYNSVSNSFKNVYYYWVKNRVIAPAGVKNRTKAVFEIAKMIADPIANGSKFMSVISPSALMLANTKPLIATEKINLNISIDTINDSANRHTEWLLLQENDPNSRPNWLLEKKLIDSLLGHDSLGDPVPDPSLPNKIKYGVEIRPRQGLFVDRRAALRNIVEFVNSVLINERITGQVDFSNLNAVEEAPAESTYDTKVEDIYNLELIPSNTLKTAKLSAVINTDGQISNVIIDDAGFGYIKSPTITIDDTGSGAEFNVNLDLFGRVVSVDILNPGKNYTTDVSLLVRPYTVLVLTDETSAGKWAIYEFNDVKKSWFKVRTQDYNTTLYWKYVDWIDSTYNASRVLASTVSEPYALEVLEVLPEGSYVKVMNGGDGRFLILRKTNGVGGTFEPSWDIVFSERGTIQILDTIWNPAETLFAWDQKIGFDQTPYDQSPDKEISFVINAIKDDIFVDSRKLHWNQLFFKAVRYAMSEQKFLDWAFKTTFISVINNAGPLDQTPTYKLNNAQYYEDFLKEIKPYHTKIRKYTEVFTGTEYTNTFNTDFDLPVYYNTATLNFNKVEFGNPMMLAYPWKAWYDNYTYEVVSIDLYDGGSGYTQVPTVTIVSAPGDTGFGAEAVAFISLGKISRILVTNPGQNYTATPRVIISGGGDTNLVTARAYAQLGNSPVRSNTVGLRFDRVTANREIGEQYFTDRFVSDGSDVTYNLTFAPLPNKEVITLKINGILQLVDAYTIIYATGNYATQKNNSGSIINEYKKLHAELKLTFIPSEGDLIEITYPKNLDLYNAASRIEDYYDPVAGMPGKELAQLMSGVEYSGLQVVGLPFNAVGGWDSQGIAWASTSWDNLGTEEGYHSYFVDTSATLITVYNTVTITTVTSLNYVTELPTTSEGYWPGSIPNADLSTVTSQPVLLFLKSGGVSGATTQTVSSEVVKIALSEIDNGGVSRNDWLGLLKTTSASTTTHLQVSNRVDLFGPYAQSSGTSAIYEIIGVTSGTTSIPGRGILWELDVNFVWTNNPTGVLYTGFGTTSSVVLGILAFGETEWSYTTESTVIDANTTTITVPSLIPVGEEVNVYVKNEGDAGPAGIRVDDPNFHNYQGTWTNFVDYSTSSVVVYKDKYYQAVEYVTATIVSGEILTPETTSSWRKISYNKNACVNTLYGLGTGAVDRIEMIVTGSGYISEFTTFSISAPNSLTGRKATAVMNITTGTHIESFTIVDPGSGYTEPPVITIIESINPSHSESSVTIQAYARAILKAEFTKSGSTATVSSITVPGEVFTSTSAVISLRYSSSDGTVTPTDTDSLDAIINGGDLSMTTALGINPGEVILDGGSTSTRHITGMNDDGFLNPINSYAPEECVPGQVRESLGITVYSQPPSISPLMSNKHYWVNGSQRTFKLGVRPVDSDSIIVLFNNERLSSSNYTIDYKENTFTFNSSDIGTGWLSITTMQLGTLSLLDSTVINSTSSSTIWTSKAGFDGVGSSYVTVNGVSISSTSTSGVPNTYTVTKYKGSTRVTVFASGTIQAYLFSGTSGAFSNITETDYVATGDKNIPLNPVPGVAGPYHSQVIVSSVSGTGVTRLNPPVTTYYEVDQDQTVFDISKSTVYSLGRIDLASIEVYVNGIRMLPARKWKLDQDANEIIFFPKVLKNGDLVAIVIKQGHDYLIEDGNLKLVKAPVPGTVLRVVTFTNHDPDFIRSERFNAEPGNQYTMQRAVFDSSYVWVTYAGRPLTLDIDYTVGLDNRTVTVRDGIFQSSTETVVVTSFADTGALTAYRIFRDMLGRTHYKRVSSINSTELAQDLNLSDSSIVVKDASVLTKPAPQFNRPGVILIDGERIEYFVIQGNTLSQLRRATLGTGPKATYFAGEPVIDQGASQTIPYLDQEQKFVSYSTASTHIDYDLNGKISFSSDAEYTDQVEVRYQGALLLKPGLTTYKHNLELGYDSAELTSTSTVDVLVPYGFTINTVTNVLTLNTATVNVVAGARLEVIKRTAQTWYSSENTTLAESGTDAARFISQTPAEMPKFAFKSI